MSSESAKWQVTFRCDGCGLLGQGHHNRMGDWFKPSHWYQRGDEEGVQLACSRRCIDLIAQKSGKTSVVLPV
jgi:hypothetical protein